MGLVYDPPVPWDPRPITIIMTSDPCPVVGILSSRGISRGIIHGRRGSIVRPAVGTERSGHNSCRSSDDGPCNRERKEKRVAIITIFRVHICDRNSDEKRKPYARRNYDFSCIHSCLPMFDGRCRFSIFISKGRIGIEICLPWKPESSCLHRRYPKFQPPRTRSPLTLPNGPGATGGGQP